MARANDAKDLVSLPKVIKALQRVQKHSQKQFEKDDNVDDMHAADGFEMVVEWLSSEAGRKAVGLKDEVPPGDSGCPDGDRPQSNR